MSEKICAIFNVSSEYPDEAIDMEKSELIEYLKTYNPAKLTFVEGSRPVKFNVKRLSISELTAVSSREKTHGQEVSNILAISYGLVSIENADGSFYTPEMTSRKYENQEFKTHKDPTEVTEYLVENYGYDIISELAIAIKKLARMPLHLTPFLPKSR